MNPFNQLADPQLSGIGSKLKKSIKKISGKIAASIVRVDDKIAKLPGGKALIKFKRKVVSSKVGQALIPAVAGFFGGAAAAMGASIIVGAEKATLDKRKAVLADKKFLASPEGQEFTQTKANLANALRDMQSTAEWRAIYDDLKSKGYSDDEIAAFWLQSKPAIALKQAAIAESVFPMVQQQARQAGFQYPDAVAAEISTSIAKDATKPSLLPLLAIGATLLLS